MSFVSSRKSKTYAWYKIVELLIRPQQLGKVMCILFCTVHFENYTVGIILFLKFEGIERSETQTDLGLNG